MSSDNHGFVHDEIVVQPATPTSTEGQQQPQNPNQGRKRSVDVGTSTAQIIIESEPPVSNRDCWSSMCDVFGTRQSAYITQLRPISTYLLRCQEALKIFQFELERDIKTKQSSMATYQHVMDCVIEINHVSMHRDLNIPPDEHTMLRSVAYEMALLARIIEEVANQANDKPRSRTNSFARLTISAPTVHTSTEGDETRDIGSGESVPAVDVGSLKDNISKVFDMVENLMKYIDKKTERRWWLRDVINFTQAAVKVALFISAAISVAYHENQIAPIITLVITIIQIMGQLSLVLLSLLLPVTLANVYSCAGFVKSSSSIDFSDLKVKLLTLEGHLKHEEEVNPSNGYFMIPVYNKGSYTLKVASPAGYYFEPDTIEIKIDGKTDACSNNEDLVFKLTGFSVRGTVDGAPAGLSLVLTQNGKQVDSTKTFEGGKYEMRAPPGKYEVSTGADASECIARGKATVEVKDSPVAVTPNLKISGYQLEIATKNMEHHPFTDAVMTLYATSFIDLPNVKCETSEGAHDVPTTHNVRCALGKTDPRGRLTVPCVPSGKYYLQPTHEDGVTSISFAPRTGLIEITQKANEAVFQAASATGRVRVLSKDLPLSNVEVVVNGQKSGKTDSQGHFTLENLKENEHTTVTATAPHTHFNTVQVNVQFPRVSVEDVRVQKFDICGQMEKTEEGKLEKLTFTRKDDKRSLEITPKSDGSFCQAVSPGQFTIEPTDKASSLTPRLLEVDVLTKPVTNLRFTHFKTNANVHVSCIGACPTSTISLFLPGQTLVRSVKGTDVFVFENIGPGTYSARLDDNGRGCWEQSEMTLKVEQSKTQPTIHFKQNGFAAQIEISHPAKIEWSNVDRKQLAGKTETKGGEVISICVPTSGVYDISLDSCYKFDQQQFKLTVPFDGVHKEKAIAARITGQIDLENDKSAGVSLRVKSSAGDREIQVSTNENGKFEFEEPLASSGEQMLMVPSSKLRLFEPTSKIITITGKCIDNAVVFKSFRGIFLDGSIKPAVENAAVKAVLKTDKDVVIETVSGKDGKFRIGPVKRIEDYDITATLDGFKFSPTSTPGHFGSVKLSQLSIKVADEVTNEPLDGVLLSLVGGKGSDYRSNNVLDATAQKNFVALAPGEYFVRAILQEYKFSPSTSTISVKEGQHENVVLKGKRVSFSAYGKMREMSANAVSDVLIEALSQGCDLHQSEATTSSDGTFRIRGLLPNCEYNVYAKAYVDGANAPHTFPRQFTVSMTPEDVKGLEFIATKTVKTTDISVEIGMESVPEVQSVRVVITKNDNEHIQTATVVAPQYLHYLVNLPRDGEEYAIRVEPERPPQAFNAKTVRVVADAAMKVARVPLTTSKKLNDVDISVGSLLSLPFFVSLALIFFNQNRVLEYLELFLDFSRSTFRPATPDNHRRRR
ncbi:hypothetical protein L5515_006968 [Caenorhabditis briggsae]|uniref:Uncharacterized protein n=1 Tax=Caenorhabditis briggsae TaxID=6238 RepID=A0AAE9JKL5_CAEBR|nr:hypothetical protein L5515_006968 [Caenorhabditis briggsae]